MKSYRGAWAVSVVVLSFIAAPTGAQQRQSRALTGFDSIEVGGGIGLFVRTGGGFAVEVQASEENAAKIVTEVVGTKLQIKRKSSFNPFHWDGDLGSVHVTLPVLVSLDASGGSDVNAEGTVSSDNLRVVASGGSDVTIDVAAGELNIEASGGSDMRVSGSARSARVESSGGSDLNASALNVDEADAKSSGGSDLRIAVRQKIVAHASGGSDITYSGQPSSVNVNTSGGAEIHHR
jgi:hypothetical protein